MSGKPIIGKLETSEWSVYHGSGMRVDEPRGKKAVVVDVWRLMLDCSMAQFGRASGILQRLGLTPGHMKLLMQLEQGSGRAMGSLAQSFQCDASTMTWLVDRLEERGLVERRMLPGDLRVKAGAGTQRGGGVKGELMARAFSPPAQLLTLCSGAVQIPPATLTQVPG